MSPPCREMASHRGPRLAKIRALAISVLLVSVASRRGSAQPGSGSEAASEHVTGRVIDAVGRPIRDARVLVEGDPQNQTTTDRAGRYQLDAARGVTIVVDKAGYQTSLAVVTGATLDDLVLLVVDDGETIEVKGEAPPGAPGSAKLDREEIERIPGTGGDLIRTLSAMPGVVSSQQPTSFSGIVIRGSAPQDSKILIDGFEVPLLYHTIGNRSILPVESIETLEYIPGGFDVAYGRATSGIVSLTTRPGATERTEQLELSLLDSGALAQGTAGADTRYMLAFRRSTIDLLLPYVIPSSADLSLTTVPHYYDVQSRVDIALSSHSQLAISTIGSLDALELYGDKMENPDKRFFSETEFLRLTEEYRWHSGPWALRLAASQLAQNVVFDLGASQRVDVARAAGTVRGELTRTVPALAGLSDVVWRTGGELDVSRYTLDLAIPTPPQEGDPSAGGLGMNAPISTTFNGVVWAPDLAAWSAISAGLAPNIRVTAGARVDGYVRGGDVTVQPRGELAIKLSPRTTARLNAGAYRRPPENQTELLHAELHPERATQVIAGIEHEPREGFRIQTSLYYTDRTHLIRTDSAGTSNNDGRGTSFGAEVLVKYQAGPWFGWLAYSLSRSTRVDSPGAEQRLFDYDQTHNLTAAASWRSGNWVLGGRFSLSSGLPYTPVTGAVFESDSDRYVPTYGATNSARYATHHQLDLRIDHIWHVGGIELTGFLDVQNVYLNSSVSGYQYAFDYSERAAFTGLPILPSLGLRGVF